MRIPSPLRPRRLGALAGIFFLLFSLAPISAADTFANVDAGSGGAQFVPMVRHPRFARSGSTPPTDAQCRALVGVPCYSPQEIQKAYGLDSVLANGINGKGQTIVIVDSFGSPTVENDLKVFDAGYGLPDPPHFQVLSPLGTVPFDLKNATQVGWAYETSLDVQWAHAIAPGANIVLLTSPVAETEGVHGMPQMLELEDFALSNHLGKVISQSWGATENTFKTPDGQKVLADFEAMYQRAADANVTVLASAGDSGVSNVDVKNQPYPFPTVIYPASSAWVTAVGGTSLVASTDGTYQSEVVWNEGPTNGATGGGVSQIYRDPDYQADNLPAADQSILNGRRGIPDIAYNADPNTGILIYASFQPKQAGWIIIGGTSEGSPQWAGLIADANQLAGHPLGRLNPKLYSLGNGGSYGSQFHDITSGNNSQNGLTGYNATTRWDLTTGWGSPKAATLLAALIQADREHHGD